MEYGNWAFMGNKDITWGVLKDGNHFYTYYHYPRWHGRFLSYFYNMAAHGGGKLMGLSILLITADYPR